MGGFGIEERVVLAGSKYAIDLANVDFILFYPSFCQIIR